MKRRKMPHNIDIKVKIVHIHKYLLNKGRIMVFNILSTIPQINITRKASFFTFLPYYLY